LWLKRSGVGPDACPSSSRSLGYSKHIGTTDICRGQELALVLYLHEALDVVLVIYLCGPHHLHCLVLGCEMLVLKAPSDYRSDHLLPSYEVLLSNDRSRLAPFFSRLGRHWKL
jgi:hypothetical protein